VGHVVVSLGIIAVTLNWFDLATSFPLVGTEFKAGLGSLSYLISLYIVAYGLTHIQVRRRRRGRSWKSAGYCSRKGEARRCAPWTRSLSASLPQGGQQPRAELLRQAGAAVLVDMDDFHPGPAFQ